MEFNKFKECASCAAKPGSPELCSSCLHNRAVIEVLDEQLEKVSKESKWFDNACVLVGNLALFAAIWYAVFILNHSGWWFAFLLLFHFSPTKSDKKK